MSPDVQTYLQVLALELTAADEAWRHPRGPVRLEWQLISEACNREKKRIQRRIKRNNRNRNRPAQGSAHG